MINKKIILKFSMAFVVSGLMLSQSFAYNPQDHDSRFFTGLFYNASFIDANQNLEKPAKNAEYNFSAVGGGATIGYRIKPNIKLEAEGVFSAQNKVAFDFASGSGPGLTQDYSAQMTYVSAMANAYYHQYISDFISGYAGLGVGVSHLTFDNLERQGKNTGDNVNSKVAFSTQLKAGISLIKVSDKFIPYVGYKFLHLNGNEIEMSAQEYKANFNTHNIQIGAIIPANSV